MTLSILLLGRNGKPIPEAVGCCFCRKNQLDSNLKQKKYPKTGISVKEKGGSYSHSSNLASLRLAGWPRHTIFPSFTTAAAGIPDTAN